MNIRNILLVLLLMGVSFAGLTVPSTSVTQESFKPGTSGAITITVANSETAEKIITGISMDIDSPPELIVEGEIFIGDLEPGGSTSVSLPFQIADDADSGIYTVEVEFTGVADKSTGGFDVFTRRLTIPVTVVDAPILSLSTDNQVITGVDSFNITISNNGGPASNLRLGISDNFSVAFYGTDEVYFGDVEDKGVETVLLDSRNAADGPIDVPFVFEYEDEIGMQHTETTNLRMTVRNEKLDLTFTQKSEIFTRQESELTLEVRNDGDELLEDVRLSFNNNSVKIKEDDEYNFGDLQPGESKQLTLVVFTELTPGLNLVDATVEWIEKDLQKSESRDLSITVTSDADVEVYLEAKPLPLALGQEHTISVLVSNLGSYAIENVDVSIASPALRSLDISDRQYIGGLQRDDFSTVQFTMEVNATSEGTYPAQMTINYRDSSGEWKQEVITQNITVYNGVVDSQQDPLPLVIGGLVVLVVLIWHFKFRKGSK